MSVATLSVSMEQRRDVSRPNRSSASRCLYGPPDREYLARKYEQCSREQAERFKDVWGYDPEKDCPVPGHDRFQWEPLNAAAAVQRPSPSEQQSDAPVQQQSPENTKSLKQSSIKDFYPERKRSASSSSAAVAKKPRPSSDSEGSSSSPEDAAASSTSSSQQVN
ncbi:uncharacterized protein LOC132197421 [Neocloeon triangulifer]|uniref:uncharacterized protein LOC132197421 n=1 Tax=Neocloeon triangulifer TaxID=2078957 RepID=UPI00286FA031|nr:uncharacterized protein LOC132197421 [Neocloeon triangulifer]